MLLAGAEEKELAGAEEQELAGAEEQQLAGAEEQPMLLARAEQLTGADEQQLAGVPPPPPPPFSSPWSTFGGQTLKCTGDESKDHPYPVKTNSAQACLDLVKNDVALNYAVWETDGDCKT